MRFIRNFSQTAIYTGFNRSVGIDFVNESIFFFDSGLAQIVLDCYETLSIEEMLDRYPDVKEELQVFTDQLIENELFFVTETPELFPVNSGVEESASVVDNVHICFGEFLETRLEPIKKIITSCRVQAAKLDFRNCAQSAICSILRYLSDTPLESIECVLDFNKNEVSKETLLELTGQNGAVTVVSIAHLPDDYSFPSIENLDITVFNDSFPKIVPSFRLFSESQVRNNYFYKKLFIGLNGELKNSHHSTRIIARIDDLVKEDNFEYFFKEEDLLLGMVQKDRIDVCRDCEFRYICVDDRIPVQKKNGDYFFDKECTFNPYITKWIYEEGYKTLAGCGIISTEDEFTLNAEKIEIMNNELWGI